MNLQSYRSLIAIAELESFSEVAKRRNMTLSSLSMQMKALERDLGVQIFDRAVRPPCLTPLGRAIAERSRRIVAEQDALIALARTDEILQGSYRIGFIATASVRLLPGFLSHAAKSANEAKFKIETGLSDSLQNKVAKRQLDAAVVTRSDADLPNLTYTNIRTEELVYALPEDLEGKTLKACFAHRPFILFTPNSGIGRLVSNDLLTRQYRPATTMILDSVEAIMECVNAGIGFTALPRPDVERYGHKTIRIVKAKGRSLKREIALVTAHGSLADQQVKVLAGLFS